jgi:hypothetical protein
MELVEVLVRQAYREKAWHGPNLRSSLRGVDVAEALWRPAPGRHNIWELTLHCAYWKQRVIARVTGVRESLPRRGTDWLPVPSRADARAWRADVRLLDEVHGRLQAMVSKLDRTALGRKGRGRPATREAEFVGIAFHDVYHAGQVRLIRRLYADRTAGSQARRGERE